MHLSILLVPFLLPFGIFAQEDTQSTAFTEPNTGIAFQISEHASSGMKFGIAIPKIPGKDFIGFFSGNIDAAPWASSTIGGPSMIGNILIVAFPYHISGNSRTPDSCKIPIGDIRMASGYTPSTLKVYSGFGDITVRNKPIRKGTFMNGEDWQYMFLCENCMANSSIAFDQKAEKVQLGYVVGPEIPSFHHHGAALLPHTERSTLSFSLNVAAAKSDKFDEWAKMAEAPPDCGPPPKRRQKYFKGFQD